MQGIGKGIKNGKYFKILVRRKKYSNAIELIEITKKEFDNLKVSFTDGQKELDGVKNWEMREE